MLLRSSLNSLNILICSVLNSASSWLLVSILCFFWSFVQKYCTTLCMVCEPYGSVLTFHSSPSLCYGGHTFYFYLCYVNWNDFCFKPSIFFKGLRIEKIVPSLYPWDESPLIRVYDLFNVLLDAVCQYFVKGFSVYVHQ